MRTLSPISEGRIVDILTCSRSSRANEVSITVDVKSMQATHLQVPVGSSRLPERLPRT